MQENKNFILILLALLVLGALGFYFVSSSSSDDMSDSSSATTSQVASNDSMVDDDMMDDEMMDDEMEMMEAPEGAMMYTITEGTASYTVNKGWLDKAAEEVTGTTTGVEGEGWMNPETGALYVMGSVDLAGLATGSAARDGDVQKLFNRPVATLVLDLENSTIEVGTPFEVEAPVMVTINGETVEVTAAVTGTVTETGFEATGSMDAMLSDFGITAPSVASLYNVADEFSMSFDVTGELAN